MIGTLKFFAMNDSYRGDTSTEREFQTLDQQEKMNVIEFLSELPYYTDRIVVCGHTPTQLIEENDRPGYIMKKNNYIAIDCGACFRGGRLAAICLDTGEEFYV